MSNKQFLVRLKPYNPRKGFKLQRYMVFGMLFVEERGWYKVNEFVVHYTTENSDEPQEINLVEYLRKVRNDNDNPESPLAFDVCTPEEAKALQEAERKAKEEAKAKAENPNPVDLAVADHTVGPTVIPAKRGRGRPPKAKPAAVATEVE